MVSEFRLRMETKNNGARETMQSNKNEIIHEHLDVIEIEIMNNWWQKESVI